MLLCLSYDRKEGVLSAVKIDFVGDVVSHMSDVRKQDEICPKKASNQV